jgi:hypothetical protein
MQMASERLFREADRTMLQVIDILVARLGGEVYIDEAAFVAADTPALIAQYSSDPSNRNFRIISSKGSDDYVLANRKDLQL